MPTEASKHLRVHIPELKAEVGIDFQPHDSFWHLKLCLVNSLLACGHLSHRSDASRPSNHLTCQKKQSRQQIVGSTWGRRHLIGHTKRSSSILNQLLSSTSQSSASSSSAGRDSLTSRARDAILAARRSRSAARCHSSIGSLSSVDTSSCSAMLATYGQLSSDSGIHEFSKPDPPRRSLSSRHNSDSLSRSSTRYYGFNGFDPPNYESDNARQSSDLTEDEDEVICALAASTIEADIYDEVSAQEFDIDGDNDVDNSVDECRYDTNSREFDEHDDYGIYAKLTLGSCIEQQTIISTQGDKGAGTTNNIDSNDDHTNGSGERSDFDELENKSSDTACNRLFEQVLKSGHLNYGASYYLDLEFKLKQRQNSVQILPSISYTTSLSSYGSCESSYNDDINTTGSNVIPTKITSGIQRSTGHSVVADARKATNRLSRLSFISSTAASTTKQNSEASNLSSNHFNETNISTASQINFSSNMIAKLASTGSQKSASAQSNTMLSSQSKRKRSKLLNLLLNTNWSKQSQQANNLLKLNKMLLVCDANFLDEKTGESPLSLAISSSQISSAAPNRSQANGLILSTPTTIGCPQSTSLFNLQSQSSVSHNQSTLQQTSVTDICQSKAPLVERILLLLIKSGALIDFRNGDGRTPLHIAAMKSNFWALKTLLDLELKVTQLLLSHNNRNPSASGASTRHASSGGNIGITDQQGWQEVHQACKLGLDAHLDKLLYYGCDMNARIRGSGNTPLHVAAINDQIHCAEILLLRGADKTITNNSHQTAHQVAVISNNMDMAEFIAQHDPSKVVLFADRASNSNSQLSSSLLSSNTDKSFGLSNSVSSHLVSSQSSSANLSQSQSSYNFQKSVRTVIVHPQLQANFSGNDQANAPVDVPLTLDIQANANSGPSSLTNGHSSTTYDQRASLTVAANLCHPHQLNPQASNISPSLSQRSCAASTNTATTSSSGVCCDGDGHHSGEELPQSRSQHSNITIISIGKPSYTDNSSNQNSFGRTPVNNCSNQLDERASKGDPDERLEEGDEDDDDDSKSGGSSSNGLQSLMSDERPLFAGSTVEATSEYQSGDPSHLQLRRGDLIEVLDYPPEVLQDGQLPRLANKPLVFGRRCSDGAKGLFPSFCVRRSRRRQSCLRQRNGLTDITNLTRRDQQQSSQRIATGQSVENTPITNLPESRSMVALDSGYQDQNSNKTHLNNHIRTNLQFRRVQVSLTKCNEGFGFVLRGAKVPPVSLANNQTGKVTIDARILAANNLASLQYLDDIEPGSVAARAGLNKGDFLVAVNGQDVRLFSHEQVVHLIRQSGDHVQLTISSPCLTSSENIMDGTKTLVKVKPEPPKRDPTTTLTRNKSNRVKSMPVAPLTQGHHPREIFDADKPLPNVPVGAAASPTGSLGTIGRSTSTNLSQFQSIQSLSSGVPDTQSISSISTVGSIDQHQSNQAHVTHSGMQRSSNHSSSSTATLTTVATKKPEPFAKPSEIHIKAAQLTYAAGSNYQPAIITTNKRVAPQTSSNPSSPPNPPPPPPLMANFSPLGSNTDVNQNSRSIATGPPSPPPPPPPPPLPELPHPGIDCSSKRRTSAPIGQLQIDSNRLLKKRDSLATITKLPISSGPPQLSAVAAACAAAANNRLLRQQQSLDQDTDKPGCIDPPRVKADSITQKTVEGGVENSGMSIPSPKMSNENNPMGPGVKDDATNGLAPISPAQKSQIISQPSSSASLGRRASAQIIRQPKNNYASQSQTLRPKTKRPAIPNYDQPLPPPPLPPSMNDIHPSTKNVQPLDDHNHLQSCQLNNRSRSGSMSKRQTHEFVQEQLKQMQQHNQIMSKHQQQLIVRQQQYLPEQQIKYHQQQQRNHHATHGGRLVHGANCQSISTSRGQQQLESSHSHAHSSTTAISLSNQHHHHHHHHHHHPNHNHHSSQDHASQRNQQSHLIYRPGPEAGTANSMQSQQTKHNGQHQYVSHNSILQGTPCVHQQQLKHPLTQVNPEHQKYSQCTANVVRHELDHLNQAQSRQRNEQQYNHHQQQEQLYQQMQRQQFIERYLPLVYSDPYAATLNR